MTLTRLEAPPIQQSYDPKARQALQGIQRTIGSVSIVVSVACVCVSVASVAATLWMAYVAIKWHDIQQAIEAVR